MKKIILIFSLFFMGFSGKTQYYFGDQSEIYPGGFLFMDGSRVKCEPLNPKIIFERFRVITVILSRYDTGKEILVEYEDILIKYMPHGYMEGGWLRIDIFPKGVKIDRLCRQNNRIFVESSWPYYRKYFVGN